MGARLVLLVLLASAIFAIAPPTAANNNNNNNQTSYQNNSLEARSRLAAAGAAAAPNTIRVASGARFAAAGVSRISKRGALAGRSDHAQPSKMFEPSDTRVPFWNIAHMINSIDQIEPSLSAGANGIETDISFSSKGVPVEVYHGFPCDCGRHCHHREDFVAFVKHLAKISLSPGTSSTSRLQLVLFDLKLKELRETRQKETAGKLIAKILNDHYYSKYQPAANSKRQIIPLYGDTSSSSTITTTTSRLVQPPLRFVVSINHASDIPLVRSFLRYLEENRLDLMRKHVGFDVGMNDDLGEIMQAWDSLRGPTTSNIWQGDGLTNCANVIRGHERLKKAVEVRNKQGHFRKVYYWTADIMYHIRSVLRFGIDALLTNKPERVLQVLREPEFQTRYRLATHYDDPFEQYWIRPLASSMGPPTIGEAVETVQNIRHTSSDFIKSIPDGLSAVLKKVHSSISSPSR